MTSDSCIVHSFGYKLLCIFLELVHSALRVVFQFFLQKLTKLYTHIFTYSCLTNKSACMFMKGMGLLASALEEFQNIAVCGNKASQMRECVLTSYGARNV